MSYEQEARVARQVLSYEQEARVARQVLSYEQEADASKWKREALKRNRLVDQDFGTVVSEVDGEGAEGLILQVLNGHLCVAGKGNHGVGAPPRLVQCPFDQVSIRCRLSLGRVWCARQVCRTEHIASAW